MMKSMSNLLMNYHLIIMMIMMILILIPLKFNKIHPLNFIIILISITFISTIKINLIYNSWLNFMLILIMIGGLMIIFMYIISISNNHLMLFNFKNIMINLLKMILILSTLIILIKIFNLNLFFNPPDSWNLNNNIIENNSMMLMSKMFNLNKNSSIYMMLYLYFSMICIMKICLKMKKPLRQLTIYEQINF